MLKLNINVIQNQSTILSTVLEVNNEITTYDTIDRLIAPFKEIIVNDLSQKLPPMETFNICALLGSFEDRKLIEFLDTLNYELEESQLEKDMEFETHTLFIESVNIELKLSSI